uniref:Ribosomal protein S13 n=1 Tax=Marophrys sp. SRT127 TaxID=2488311 RepID=A0A455RHY2_9EUKA|nr:ribosomal protein S13 [Marophrys sp. SRT127]
MPHKILDGHTRSGFGCSYQRGIRALVTKMVYIFNTYIPVRKRIRYALTSIYGIGNQRASKITGSTNILCINPRVRFDALTPTQISEICKCISSNWLVSGALRKNISENIKRHLKIRSYRGIRHKNRLPVRGQRTHTNARTQKRRPQNFMKLIRS